MKKTKTILCIALLVSCVSSEIYGEEVSAAPVASAKSRAKKEVIKASIVVAHIGQVNLGTGLFNVEFFLSLTCPADVPDCRTNFVLLNGTISSKDKVDVEGLKTVYKVKAEAHANLDFKDFPLDSHVLPLVIMDKEDGADDVTFEADTANSSIDDKVAVSGYRVAGSHIFAVEEGFESLREKYSLLHFEIRIAKATLTSVLKTYFPAAVILFIAMIGLILHGKNINTRLSMGTGGLLASVMFHVSSTSSLPSISYLTRTDKFMIAIYSALLMHILVAVYTLAKEDEKGDDPVKIAQLKKIYKVTGFGLPIYAITVLLLVVFHIV